MIVGRIGLRGRLTLALLGLALVPLGVATAVLMRVNLVRLELSAREFRLAVSQDAVRDVSLAVEKASEELGVAGAALAERDADIEDRLRTVRAQLLGTRFVDRVALYDRAGQHVDTLEARGGPGRIQRPEEIPPALRARLADSPTVFGDVELSPAGRPVLPVTRALYAGPERSLYGYVWTAVDLEGVRRVLGDKSQQRFSGEEQRIFAIDDRFRVVLHGDRSRLLQPLGEGAAAFGLPESGAFLREHEVSHAAEYVTPGGEEVLGILVPVPPVGWGLVVEQPRAEVYAGVRATWQTALAVGAGFTIVALVLGLLLGRRLARPVLEVAAAARKVAGGDFGVRVQVRGGDEVGQMAEAFNGMARDLGDYRDRLVAETRIRADLSRYLSPELVEEVVARRAVLKLGGDRREVTVLFADVVSFTPLAEEFPPEQVVSVLNEVFTVLTEIVFRHGGIVDKFIGDCVMAVFGVPESREDDPLRAVRAADEMVRWIRAANAKWRKEIHRDIEIGIGVNTGVVIAGNVGSEKRMEYTVIGDSVNIAARLEPLARPGQVLMSRDTMERVRHEMLCDFVSRVRLTGRKQETEVYTLAE